MYFIYFTYNVGDVYVVAQPAGTLSILPTATDPYKFQKKKDYNLLYNYFVSYLKQMLLTIKKYDGSKSILNNVKILG